MDYSKPQYFILVLHAVLALTALPLGKSSLAGELNNQYLEGVSTYQETALAPIPFYFKHNETLSQSLRTLTYSGFGLFSSYTFFDHPTPVFALSDGENNEKKNAVVEWLEVTLSPIYQLLRGLRRSDTDKQSLSGGSAEKEVALSPSNAHFAEVSSSKLNQAILAATDRYQGVLLSVKRVAIEQAIYRIKILRESGELRTIDYNEEQDQFISDGDESWYANTVD